MSVEPKINILEEEMRYFFTKLEFVKNIEKGYITARLILVLHNISLHLKKKNELKRLDSYLAVLSLVVFTTVWKVLSGFLIPIWEVLVLYSSKTWALHGESEKYPVKGIEIKFSIY